MQKSIFIPADSYNVGNLLLIKNQDTGRDRGVCGGKHYILS